MYKPLVVKCRPHALYYGRDRWLKLDSLLLKAVLMELHGAAFYALPSLTPATPAEQLQYPEAMPLARRERHGEWYYACSWADVPAATLHTEASAYTRRFSEQAARRYGDHRGRGRFVVHTGKGADKAMAETIRLRTISELVWYAVGDAVEIKRLLESRYAAIGKKEAQGCGQLSAYENGERWHVAEVEEDFSEHDAQGNLTRGLPVLEGGVLYPVRPPYYVRANYVPLELPA